MSKPIKLSGADFKEWLGSKWERPDHPDDDSMWDDVWVLIDGNGTDDPVLDDIADTAEIVVETGVVCFDQNRQDSPTIEATDHIRKWLKSRDTETIVLSVDKNAMATVMAWIKETQGVKLK